MRTKYPQQKLSAGGVAKKQGEVVRIGGKSAMAVGGIVAPGDITNTSHKSSHHSQSTRHTVSSSHGQLVTKIWAVTSWSCDELTGTHTVHIVVKI